MITAAQDIPKIGCINHDCDVCQARPPPEQTAKRPVTNRCPKCVGLSCLCDGSCIKREQEPVGEVDGTGMAVIWSNKPLNEAKLYTSPPQRQPLTEEEMDLICEKALFCRISFQQFARSIEAAHGIGEKT